MIGAASIAVSLYGIYRHIAKYAAGRALTSPLEWKQNLSAFGDIFSHRSLRRRDKAAGLAHTGVFYGYLIGFICDNALFHSNRHYQAACRCDLHKGTIIPQYEFAA